MSETANAWHGSLCEGSGALAVVHCCEVAAEDLWRAVDDLWDVRRFAGGQVEMFRNASHVACPRRKGKLLRVSDLGPVSLSHLLSQELDVRAGSQGNQLELVGELGDDVQRLGADRPGGAQDREALRCTLPRCYRSMSQTKFAFTTATALLPQFS